MFKEKYSNNEAPEAQVRRLASFFKVSTLVIIRRLHDAGLLSREAMWAVYKEEQERLRAIFESREPGGSNYLAQGVRVSRRFAEAVYTSAWEGQSSFTDAMRLLNIKNMKTFRNFGASLGLSFAQEARGELG